ncbi:DUF2274 domain-containing protein [Sphingobium sp. TKS]|uniref:DUF2274 domain-containing protein n=1 Tax=Sphingobium sp. TKS TaxID=1315974 RepID=UPI00077006C3|nr:hypothetical protein K426_04725 [Sphingobium sp. TKS]AMK23449.1 hypothetical protein K426_12570 [Sphingobium sp. TKS]
MGEGNSYAAALAAETGGDAIPPEKLASPMLAKFMASDRGSPTAMIPRAEPSG